MNNLSQKSTVAERNELDTTVRADCSTDILDNKICAITNKKLRR